MDSQVLAFYGVQALLMRMQYAAGDDRQVDFIFDEQGKQVGQALAAWKYWTAFATPEARVFVGNPPISRNDHDFLPLQAADLLAWRCRRKFVDETLGKCHPVMDVSDLHCLTDEWDRDRLRAMPASIRAVAINSGRRLLYDVSPPWRRR